LAADIAVVSSVSGGCVYAAHPRSKGPNHAAGLMDRIQNNDGIGWLTRRALNPALPIAFTPVLPRNDSYRPGGCPAKRTGPASWQLRLEVPGDAHADLETYRSNRYPQSQRNESVHEQGADSAIEPYRWPLYLRPVDGGVADNSGLTALRYALRGRMRRPVSGGRSRKVGCAASSS